MKRTSIYIVLSVVFVVLFTIAASAEDIVVIVHPDNNNSVTSSLVRRIYGGESTSWPDGKVVVALALPGRSNVHAEFISRLFQGDLTPAKYKSIWDEKLFSGKGKPPKELFSEDLVISLVSLNKKAIGYVKASSVTSKVKVALTLP